MSNPAEIDGKIAKLKEQLEELERQKIEATNDSLGTPKQRILASTLHSMFCRTCIEGRLRCGWYQEHVNIGGKGTIFIWSSGEHRLWLNRALEIEKYLADKKLEYENNIEMVIHILSVVQPFSN